MSLELTQNTIKSSGEEEAFSTGSVRDQQKGKGAFHLVPTWVTWLVSRVYEDGAVRYSPRNWEKGQPLSQYIKSAENHIAKLKLGMRDEPHASMVVWNLFGYIFTAVLIKLGRRPGSLSDMPDQLHCVPGVIAEPLSNMEYVSLNTFFAGEETIELAETSRHLSVEEEAGKQKPEETDDAYGPGPMVFEPVEYVKGWQAHVNRESLFDNPYPRNSREADHWHRGWTERHYKRDGLAKVPHHEHFG